MPAIADVTLNVSDIYEPVQTDKWIHYGSTAELNKALNVFHSSTGKTDVVEVKTKTPLERTVDSAQVAVGHNTASARFNFFPSSTTAENEAEVQGLIDMLTLHKVSIAANKTFY